MAIVFTDYGAVSKLRNKRKLKQFVAFMLNNLDYKIQTIQYIFCNNTYLLGINREYLGHEDFTDIITFDLSDVPREIISDIYISIDMVQENAQKYQQEYERELHRVIFHGLLHLIGYQDKTQKEQEKMTSMENQWLEEYKNFLSDDR